MMGRPGFFEHLVFDLDDTLLDTYRQLLPLATREACAAMVSAGLATDVETCLLACNELRKQQIESSDDPSRNEVFFGLAQRFGVRDGVRPDDVVHAGLRSFYDRKIETDISLFPGARETLSELRKRYDLYLVTSGTPSTQQEKIRILEIGDYFKQIICVDITKNERKYAAFASIMRMTGSNPERHLSIGNRIDTDIAEARMLNWKTCWVRYGEYADREPLNDSERPDFIIRDIKELIDICRL